MYPLNAAALYSLGQPYHISKIDKREYSFAKEKKIKKEESRILLSSYSGSSSWTRTNDPAVNSRMLYQLSY